MVKAFAWASALPPNDEGRRHHLVKGIASAGAPVAPAEAECIVTQHINPNSSVQIQAAMQVVRDWGSQKYPRIARSDLASAGLLH